HSSGGHLDSFYPLAMHDRPQEMGSEITYSKRYAGEAILGISSEEDDDGAAAQKSEKAPARFRDPAIPEAQLDREVAQAFPDENSDIPFLRGSVIRHAKARGMTKGEMTALEQSYLRGVWVSKCENPDDLRNLYLFLGDSAAVGQWRKERAL